LLISAPLNGGWGAEEPLYPANLQNYPEQKAVEAVIWLFIE